ncbi:MFS transporter [Raoultella terrigena]|uniref:MFS transporter n=1 Tax=Raoultella terrigena TaxID=577 RepID=UPI003BAC7BE1
MANLYRDLFAVPGTGHFSAAGLLARLPLPMAGIGIITLFSQQGGYALAGAISATFVLTYALLSPQISRYVDRYGQLRVLPVATTISVTGFLILIACSYRSIATWAPFFGASLAGFMPSMSAMVRARWTALYRGQARLQTAYSLETVLDELTFIVGPPLSIGLSIALFPQAGLLLTALLLFFGVFALVLQRGTEPPIMACSGGKIGSGSVMGMASVRLLALLMVAMGVIVGTIDIVSVAYAGQLGQPAAAGLVLSAYAAGSCLSGLLYGSLKLKTPLHRLLWLGGLATATTTVPLILVTNLTALAAAVLVAGLFFAPTMIVAMSLIERQVSESQLTEGMTWLLAGLNVGVALGAAIAGQVVDSSGSRVGFYVAFCAGVLVLLMAFLSHLTLHKQDNRA